jgi:hypothetical protein
MLNNPDNTPLWRIYKSEDGKIRPVLAAWYTEYKEEDFLTSKTFGTKEDADAFLNEFWKLLWRVVS